jgi:hypothetical protein
LLCKIAPLNQSMKPTARFTGSRQNRFSLPDGKRSRHDAPSFQSRIQVKHREILVEFLAAWCKDWIALMSGIVSVGLLFWAPSQSQSKYGLFIVSVLCFVFGSYRIWAKQYQRVCELTAKTPIEAIDDLFPSFKNWKIGTVVMRKLILNQWND